MTIYVPDELASEVKAELGDQNISAICQTALRKELDRAKARADIAAEGFERIQVYDTRRRRNVAFKGRFLGEAEEPDTDGYDYLYKAYLTPKNAIAVHVDDGDDGEVSELRTYDTYAALIGDDGMPNSLLAAVANPLGEDFAEELDI